ncbi:unnamed protein product [Cyclocybe aegerita]|uniref:Major facilitator superfamily (MFS) profile domain-containing protein n=1 Tax=Cyclocybe aegerita TaxID=1973307 RepID=A0A8S0X062_CYCAE|nr:unnamed protein product [Cyclocybe aegerita]
MSDRLTVIDLVTSSQLESHGTVSTVGVGVGVGDGCGDGTEMEEKKGAHNSSALSPSESGLPEGGHRAWLTIFGAFLVQYASFGYINAFGVYQDFYVRDYLSNYSPSDIGWIGGVQIFLNFFLGVFTGRIFDRGHFRSLIIGSILLHAIALFSLSLSRPGSYYQVFLTNGVAFGLSCGLSYIPSLSVVGHYFERRRALAVGIVSSGSALGAVLHPIMLNKLFNSPHVGFHTGIRISAALNILLLVIAYAVMKPNPRFSPGGPPKSSEGDETQPRNWSDRFPVLRWLREPAYAISVFASVFSFSGTFFPVFYLQLDAITHGIDPTFAFYALSIINAASIAGRTIPGALAPHVGLFNLGSAMILAMGAVLFCMAPAVSSGIGIAPVVAFALLFGFFSGAAIALTPAMFAQLAEDSSEVGAMLGVVFGVGGLFGLLGKALPTFSLP